MKPEARPPALATTGEFGSLRLVANTVIPRPINTIELTMMDRAADGSSLTAMAPGMTPIRPAGTRSLTRRQSMCSWTWVRLSRDDAVPQTLATKMPWNGPSASVRNGAATRANPIPVARIVTAPTRTAAARPAITSQLMEWSRPPGQVGGFLELAQTLGAAFAAEAGLLRTAHRAERDRWERVVDADDAGVEPLGEPERTTRVPGEHVSGQAHLGAVGEPGGLLVGIEGEDAGRRAKHLLGGQAAVRRHVRDQGRRDPEAVARQVTLGGKPAPAGGDRLLDETGDSCNSVLVDHRAEVGDGCIGAGPEAQLVESFGQPGAELIGDRGVDQEPVDPDAGLAGVAELAELGLGQGHVEVGVGVYDERRVAAELEHRPDDPPGGLGHDLGADLGAAGEGDAAD